MRYFLVLYRTICLVAGLLISLTTTPIQGQTIKAIIVADFDDALLRSASLKDVEIMAQNCRQISQGIRYSLQRIDLNREQFTGAAVRAMLDTLTAQPGDVLLFYYTGHGFNTEANASNYPYLKLKDWQQNPLSLDEISSRLEKKAARLKILIGDCCNGVVPRSRTLAMAPVHKGMGVADDQNRVLQKLFVDACGTVKVASAQRTQLAQADPANGSLYTQAFENAFENALDKNRPESVSWEMLLSDTQNRLNTLLTSAESPGQQPFVQKGIAAVTVRSCSSVNPPEPAQCVTFDKVNQYVNDLIDSSKSREQRLAILKEASQLFAETAYVKLYVGDSPVPPNQSLKSWLNKLYLNANRNILRVEFIERESTRTADCRQYATIAVQEIWKP